MSAVSTRSARFVAGAPRGPGVYLFRDRNDTVLYVGSARDLRPRLRSYFAGDRQRPAVEAALQVLERVEWRRLGSELEAALEELRLIRELRPPANSRVAHPERYVYLQRRGDGWATVTTPGPLGPLTSRNRARACARALEGFGGEHPAAAVPALRAKLRRLARDLRFEDAARVRDRLAALEHAVERIAELERMRALQRVRARRPRSSRASGARSWSREAGLRASGRSRPEAGAGSRWQPRSPRRRSRTPSFGPEDADALLVVSQFLRRPGPELRIVELDAEAILAA